MWVGEMTAEVLPSILRVAAVTWGVREIRSPEEFFSHLTALVTEAVGCSARLIVLPELFEVELLSLFGDGEEHEVVGHLVPFCDHLDDSLRRLATRHGIVIVGGSHLRQSAQGVINVATIAWPDGRLFYQPKNCRTMWEQTPWGLAYQTGLMKFPDPRLGVLVRLLRMVFSFSAFPVIVRVSTAINE